MNRERETPRAREQRVLPALRRTERLRDGSRQGCLLVLFRGRPARRAREDSVRAQGRGVRVCEVRRSRRWAYWRRTLIHSGDFGVGTGGRPAVISQ